MVVDEDDNAHTVYVASKTACKFHKSDKFIRLIIGPVGGGKSVACVQEVIRRAALQTPHKGVRRSRWAIVRNTYKELLDTTMKTWFDWIEKEYGVYSVMHSTFDMRVELPDGSIMELEVLFRALDKPDDIKKLLSLELTGIWFNECREIPKQLVDMGATRVGRYPPIRLGGPSWFGIILDTNPPDSDSWIYKMFEDNIPENCSIYHQPSGLSDEAENIENLPLNYYTNLMAGKVPEWINVYIHGMYGFVSDDKPVYSQYNDSLHYVDEVFVPNISKPIYTGTDFGLTPAIVFGQLNASGGMDIFDELQTFDMAAKEFGGILKQKMQTQYRGFTFENYGDPAGNQRAQTDEVTPYMILAAEGVDVYPTYTNDPDIRIEVVSAYLRRLDISGKPALRIWRGAPATRKAMAGGYKYKRLQVTGEERYKDVPDKNKHSHIADALQYLFVGAVGESVITGGYGSGKIEYGNQGIV